MANFNHVVLAGNLTADPETKPVTTANGLATVTKFSLAVNNPRNKDEVTFVRCIAWNKLGDTCQTYLHKASNILIEGRLVIRSYEDKEGVKRQSTEIVISEMQMLGSKPGNGQAPSHAPDANEPEPQPDGQDLDAIPF